MKGLRRFVLYMPVVALVFSVAVVPVAAHEGHDHGEDNLRKRGDSRGSQMLERQAGDRKELVGNRGRALVGEAQKKRPAKSKEARQKACKTRKQGIEKRALRIVTAAERHQARLDKVLTRVITYQADVNLPVPDWVGLVTGANAAKTESEASLTALKSVKPTLDCNSESVATDVATFKVAADQARDGLKAYKQAVQSLLQAVRDAKPSGMTEGQ